MNQHQLIQEIEGELLKSDLPQFNVGDTLTIHTRIIEGEKERLQGFTGTVIAKRGGGLSETVALYRVSYGAGMERVFMIHSPKIAKIEMIRAGKVRKAKLYYLRGTSGKKSKVKGRIEGSKKVLAVAKPANTGETPVEPAT